MADYQRIVEFLRDLRTSENPQVTDEVRQAAAEYAQLCQQANERLRQCTTFLQQGLRAEAIHLAEQTPNLLDMVAALDLPDAEKWIEFCQQRELPVPELIMMDRATQLNDAYEQGEGLEQLLSRHRKLALCRAPVKERLATMRQIAAKDAGSTFWEKDIRLFEQVRLKELKHDFTAAVKNRDNPAIATLASEVLETPWYETIPEDLRHASENAFERIRLSELDARLQELLEQLRKAYAAKSHAECAQLLEEIRKLLSGDNPVGVSSQVAAEMKPIMAWVSQQDAILAEQKAFGEQCDKLEVALNMAAPDHELEGIYQKLQEYDLPIPQPLEERYQTAMGKRARASQRNFWIAITAVAAVVVLALVFGYHMMQRSNVNTWVTNMQAALDKRDLNRAQDLKKQQESKYPQFDKDPRLIDAKKKIDLLAEQIGQANSQLSSLLETIGQKLAEARKVADDANAPANDLLTMATTLEEGAKVFDGSVAELKWVDPENKLPAAVGELTILASALREKATGVVAKRIEELTRKVEALAQPSGDYNAQRTQMDDLAAQIESLRHVSQLRDDARQTLGNLADRVEQARKQLATTIQQQELLQSLRDRLANSEELTKALQEFAAQFPGTPLSQQFTAAIARNDANKDIEAWRDLAGPWKGQLNPPNETVATQRAQAIQAYLSEHPRSPYAPAAGSYMQYLAQAAGALALNNTWQAGFKDLLTTPLISDLKCLTATDGRRFYMLKNPDIVVRRKQDSVFVSFKVLDPNNLTQTKIVNLMPPATLTSEQPVPVPHAKVAETITQRMKLVDAENWDTFGLGLVDYLLDNKELDPVVKAIMLQPALQINTKVLGWAIGDSYDKTIQSLAKQAPDTLVWYDAEKPVPAGTLEALQNILDRIPHGTVMKKHLADREAELFKSVNCAIFANGVLLRDSGGNWSVMTATQPPDGTTILAPGAISAAATQGNSSVGLLTLGHYKDGKCVIDENALSSLPQGSMVFLSK